MTALPPLPIDAATPDLVAALARGTTAVLVAPPGAGKTTRVPLVLAAEPWAVDKKILVLEPRRLAARAAAARMAKTLGEKVGDTVGYRVRFGTMVSKRTRIEVITEGVFTGLIQDDPSLDGVGAVLFDEFHERSLDADLGLALARDAQQSLREDLRLLVMSATIDGVRVVVDSGLARVPRYEPDVGLTRLETVRVSRAAADQRRGRAGRVEPGVCYRLWDEPQTAALEPYAPPEILAADLSSLVLELAHWGVSDPAKLVFLDPPPAPALNEARALLAALGAIDGAGRITEEGKLLNHLPLPPRLARMVVDAGREGAGSLAAEIAAVLTERGLGGNDVDLRHRIEALRRDRSARATEARRMAKRWAEMASPSLGAGSPSPRLPSGRLRPSSTGYGEGRGEGASPQAQTRGYAPSPGPTLPSPSNGGGKGGADLSPHAGGGGE